MIRRGWRPCSRWFEGTYRGKNLEAFDAQWVEWSGAGPTYPEHTEAYLRQGVEFLQKKLQDEDFPLGKMERNTCWEKLNQLGERKRWKKAGK